MDTKEVREEILKRLYSGGFKFIAKDYAGSIYAYDRKPEKDGVCWLSIGQTVSLYIFKDLFRDIKFEDVEPYSIAEEVNIIDWSKIPRDTKVLVSNDGEKWYKKHFKEYKEDCVEPFVVYCFGNTSWTSETITAYKYCKLAEEEE